MLDDEGQFGKMCRGIVDIMDIKGITIEWIHSRSLVNMQIGNAKLRAFFHIGVRIWVRKFIALRIADPLGCVEFDSLDVPFTFHPAQLF